jgi:hypothetical protein
MVALMTAGIDDDEVPFEAGKVKLRGFPPAVAKADVIKFFEKCGTLTEEDVKMVYSADGVSLGEAFVRFAGPDAKLRLALARDRSTMPAAGGPVEVLTSMEEDEQRRIMSGCVVA